MYDSKGRTIKDEVLTKHTPMVKKLAHQLKAKLPPNIEVDDLIQAGMIGLLDALSKYEETVQAQFETYAVQRIRGAMLDQLRENDWMPRGTRKNMKKIELVLNELQQEYSRHPTEIETAKKLKVSLKEYQKMLSEGAGHQLVYFDDFNGGSGEDSDHFLDRFYSDTSSDPLQALINHGFRAAVIKAIENLPEREKLLMGLYYEQELNLKEIGVVLDISESRVSQIHSQAIARMRGVLRNQKWTGLSSNT
jgi:RNA polymerase sigma factor for flagellar operon FliA